MYGGWYGGMWDPWYSGWYGYPSWYGYGPGVIVGSSGRGPAYGARTTNLDTYNRSNINRGSSGYANSNDVGYRSTYGVRNSTSVNTNSTNSSASGRGNALRESMSGRYNNNSSNVNNRPYNESYSRPSAIDRSSSPTPSSSGNSGSIGGGSSGGRAGGVSGGAGRRL